MIGNMSGLKRKGISEGGLPEVVALFAIYLLDFVLPQVSKLSKSLQTGNLDLFVISGIVDATLHTLEDAILSAANWVLQLLYIKDEMETTGIKFNYLDITNLLLSPLIYQLSGKILNNSTKGGYKQAVKRNVHKFNVKNYVSTFECPCKCMFGCSGGNCFCRTLIFTNENYIKT